MSAIISIDIGLSLCITAALKLLQEAVRPTERAGVEWVFVGDDSEFIRGATTSR